jgi:xanthine dehydrogenase accessory factor
VVGDPGRESAFGLMDSAVLAAAAEYTRARHPFVLATVVWRRAPSSGRTGSKALVHPDGTIEGWLGGACSEPTVVREALAALDDGQPRLLFLGPADEFGGDARAGTRVFPMACDNEGALEVYVEPFVPAPQVVIVGRSPAVHALTVQARALGWDVVVVDDAGRPDDHPVPEVVRTMLDLTGLGIGPSSAIVISTQGHYDDQALRAALATDAGYIGVVAAEKRASTLLQRLAEDGVDHAALARVHAPAGLDLGSIDHVEIAVAVLGDLVARRAAGQLQAVAGEVRRREAIDPVCGMTVFVDDAKHHAVFGGADHWFCSEGCRRAFEREPESYVR